MASKSETKSSDSLPGGEVPEVSILVVNYNGDRFLPALLDSLAAIQQPTHEVVVVDNASGDGSLPLLAARSWVKVVRSSENRGFAGGNNLGLGHCSGKYVLLLNNDTVVPPDFLIPLCAYLNANPQVGVVQGKMLLPNYGGALDVCGSFLTALGFPYHYGYFKQDSPKYGHPFPIFSGKGACLLFRRGMIRDVGGFLFDESFFCYYEETDFCHRAWLAGQEVHFVPGPPIQHMMGGTAGGPQSGFVLRHYLRNMTFSLLSNLSFSSRLRIMPVFFAVLAASLAAAALKGNRISLSAHWGAITHAVSQYGNIRKRRAVIYGMRRRTDQEIFSKVLRTPRPEYFIKTFSGSLSSYEDETLP